MKVVKDLNQTLKKSRRWASYIRNVPLVSYICFNVSLLYKCFVLLVMQKLNVNVKVNTRVYFKEVVSELDKRLQSVNKFLCF